MVIDGAPAGTPTIFMQRTVCFGLRIGRGLHIQCAGKGEEEALATVLVSCSSEYSWDELVRDELVLDEFV